MTARTIADESKNRAPSPNIHWSARNEDIAIINATRKTAVEIEFKIEAAETSDWIFRGGTKEVIGPDIPGMNQEIWKNNGYTRMIHKRAHGKYIQGDSEPYLIRDKSVSATTGLPPDFATGWGSRIDS